MFSRTKVKPAKLAQGFTLIELMVTIAILAIVTTLAAPSMVSFVARWQLSNAVNTFTSSMKLARSEAVKRGRSAFMCRTTNGTTCTAGGGRLWATGWIVYVDNDNSSSLTANDTTIWVQQNLTAIDTISSSNFTEIQFTPAGTLRNGQGAQGLTFNWDNGGVHKRGLCISFSGRTRLVAEQADCQAGGQG
ncbi:GspH/FimT family pseudopilin [Variovorax sp. PCZ-1]|uniref:GspH/FimT family pseudopilin n=1 Tax=Variovorax sp. PCZ-1 TaxID=2835533 RepID=UPI001BCE082C|nr:GspH/FimT family pseudopilin [Variovorax sp. PCZ-1]MBS7807511.1 GspH/FimT family pseudopilin [Variovorax sp. PCZ-1]